MGYTYFGEEMEKVVDNITNAKPAADVSMPTPPSPIKTAPVVDTTKTPPATDSVNASIEKIREEQDSARVRGGLKTLPKVFLTVVQPPPPKPKGRLLLNGLSLLIIAYLLLVD